MGETATYKPSINDLETGALVFRMPITVFFPEPQSKSRANALITATADLDDRSLQEVTLYAQFRGLSEAGGELERRPASENTRAATICVISWGILCHLL